MTPTQTLIAVILLAALVVAGAVWLVLAEPITDDDGQEEWLTWPEPHDPQPYDQDHRAKIYPYDPEQRRPRAQRHDRQHRR